MCLCMLASMCLLSLDCTDSLWMLAYARKCTWQSSMRTACIRTDHLSSMNECMHVWYKWDAGADIWIRRSTHTLEKDVQMCDLRHPVLWRGSQWWSQRRHCSVIELEISLLQKTFSWPRQLANEGIDCSCACWWRINGLGAAQWHLLTMLRDYSDMCLGNGMPLAS